MREKRMEMDGLLRLSDRVEIAVNGEVTDIPYSEDKLNQVLEASSNYIFRETPLPIKRKNNSFLRG